MRRCIRPLPTFSTSSAATTDRTSSRGRSTNTIGTCRSFKCSTSEISERPRREGRIILVHETSRQRPGRRSSPRRSAGRRRHAGPRLAPAAREGNSSRAVRLPVDSKRRGRRAEHQTQRRRACADVRAAPVRPGADCRRRSAARRRRTAPAEHAPDHHVLLHYDGQPVNAAEWIYEPPFKPVIVAPHEPQGRTITLETWRDVIDPERRVYGRSSSDDKSPIMALLSAIEALDAPNIPLTSNVPVVLGGEEEAGSPPLHATPHAPT